VSEPAGELAPDLARLRLAVFDFDGVFTDNRVWTNQQGEESVACNRSDGLGLRRLDEVGIGYLIVSSEANDVVAERARKLGADCIQAAADKLAIVIEQAERRGVGLDEIAYLGNDLNDAHCLKAVGLPVVPADAWPEVVPLARWVLGRKGGEGCVREFCDEVWRARREAGDGG
jgi:3-deoxy-D-manno-octulosonate 8-phosphate phosphatase (KDO 8-P phosphatase)